MKRNIKDQLTVATRLKNGAMGRDMMKFFVDSGFSPSVKTTSATYTTISDASDVLIIPYTPGNPSPYFDINPNGKTGVQIIYIEPPTTHIFAVVRFGWQGKYGDTLNIGRVEAGMSVAVLIDYDEQKLTRLK